MFKAISTIVGVSTAFNADSMKRDLQAYMDYVSDITGFGFSLGYVDKFGNDFGLASGSKTF